MSNLLLSFGAIHPEAGCDEAGRGCFAGPVFAAAVILPPDFSHPLLNDSKQVKEADRVILKKYIEENAVAHKVAMVDVEEMRSRRGLSRRSSQAQKSYLLHRGRHWNH
jgi:ribonuclease HII